MKNQKLQELKEKGLKKGRIFTNEYKLLSARIYLLFNRYKLWIVMGIAAVIGLVFRYLLVTYPTHDVIAFVFDWIEQIKTLGFKNFYNTNANYSSFYLFMLAIFSLLPTGPSVTVAGQTYYLYYMYYLKTVLFLFDYLIAFGVFLIVKEVTKSKTQAAIGFCLTIILPVEWAISSMWGNCDSMYAAFFLFVIYFVLVKKDGWAWFFFGLSIANKLQAVFILPFMVYLWLNRRISLWKIICAAFSFFLTCLPAWFCGAPFSAPFKFIGDELTSWSSLFLGSANMWQIFGFYSSAEKVVVQAATWIGLCIIGVFMAVLYFRKIELTEENIVYLSAFLIGLVPFVLPHMHERYFYSLDILVLVYVLIKKKRIYLVPMMQLSSGIACFHYLSGKYFIESWGEDSVHIAAYLNLAVLTIIFIDLMGLNHLDKAGEEKELQEVKEEITSLKSLRGSQPQEKTKTEEPKQA